mmetsp:Transcript_56214/g.162950  ORF Transcript_56214/g.162950 Transcript_56214/m.162950 type:complete len:221 (+) Transcript_56214:34-696(+)
MAGESQAPAPDEEQPPLRIRVNGACGLRKADPLALSDPLCIIELSGKEWRTPVVSQSLEPKWDFEIMTRDYRLGDRIYFTVKDRDMASNDDVLGKHCMSCADWGYPLGFKGDVPLIDPRRHATATSAQLSVELGPLPPSRRFGTKSLPAAVVSVPAPSKVDPHLPIGLLSDIEQELCMPEASLNPHHVDIQISSGDGDAKDAAINSGACICCPSSMRAYA